MPRDANQSFRRNYKTDQTVVRIQMTEAPFSYIIGKKMTYRSDETIRERLK